MTIQLVPGGHFDHAFGTGPVDYNTVEEIERFGEVLGEIFINPRRYIFLSQMEFSKVKNAGILGDRNLRNERVSDMMN